MLDGGTLRLGDRMLRLDALQVPERGQATCRDAAAGPRIAAPPRPRRWPRLVAGRDLACRIRGEDRHGRALGTCEAGGVELNAALVAAGWALADGGGRPALPRSRPRPGRAGAASGPRAAAPEAWRRGF